jgi:hypothetical protein
MTNASIAIYNNDTATYDGGIDNKGQINFYGAGGDQISSDLGMEYLINEGTINEEAGTGPSAVNSYMGVLQGTYNAAAGTTVQFNAGSASAPLSVGTPPTLNGPGKFQLVSGYTLLTLDAIPNLDMIGGVVNLGPAFQRGGSITNLILDGTTLNSPSSQISGMLVATNTVLNGVITVKSGGTLNLYGATLSGSGSLAVQSGGVLDAASHFNVEGPLTNAGTINLTNASLAIYNNNSPTYSGGIDNLGQINFYGASGDQISSDLGEEFVINQGAIIQHLGTGNSAISCPSFLSPGTIEVEEGTLFVSALSLQPSSALIFGLNSATDNGAITFSANAALNGTVAARYNNGFVPGTGSTFKVMTYPSFSGIFTGTNFPAGTVGQVVYGATALNLTITSASAPPNQPVLTIEKVEASTVNVSWPTAGGSFELETSPEPFSGKWSIVSNGITTVGRIMFLRLRRVGKGRCFG